MKYLFVSCLFFAGCCTVQERIITRTDTLTVFRPAEFDTVTITNYDTVWQGETVKYLVRVDTLFKKVFINRKPEKILVPYLDSIAIYQQLPDEPSWIERQINTILTYGAIIIALIFLYRRAIR